MIRYNHRRGEIPQERKGEKMKVKVAVIDMYTGEVKTIVTERNPLGGITLNGAYDILTVTDLEEKG